MKVLFISSIGLATDLAKQIKNSGHEVKLFVKDIRLKNIFDGIIEKTNNWENELDWVGKSGLIIFDDNGFGSEQEKLRGLGYSVFGGNSIADQIEYNREFTKELFEEYQIISNPLKSFSNLQEAIDYIKNKPRKYTIKREGANSKFITFVGENPTGEDVIEILKNYYNDPILKKQPFSIQEKVDGIEIGVARYFNGQDWIGPIEMNVEHPYLFAGDIGPLTDEMGTVAWYTEKETKLYKETLKKLEPFLRKINYKGDMGINTIINKNGCYALETTPRLGSPITHLQTTIQQSDWALFLKAIADGEDFKMKYKKGYGVVISLSVPPFPFQKHFQTDVCNGLTIDTSELTQEDWKNVHLDEVIFDKNSQTYKVSSQTDGFIMYVTGFDKWSVKKAKEKALAVAKKIHLPKMFYRIDIGDKFAKQNRKTLKKWGWI